MKLSPLALTLLGASIALAQQIPPGGLPSRAEIEKRVQEEFDKLPDESSELDAVKLTYKPVPASPADVIKQAGPMPPGIDPDQAAKQFGPIAKPYIEKYMGRVGKLKLSKEVKQKTSKIPEGEYTFGLVMDELLPVAVTISGGGLKAPVQVPIKAGAAPAQPFDKLKVEVKAGKAKDEFVFAVSFGKLDGQSGKFSLKK